MMRALAGIALLAACGQAASTGPAPVKPQPPQPQVTQVEASHEQTPAAITPEFFCDRFTALSSCAWTQKMMMDKDSCMKMFSSGDPDAATVLEKFGPCVRDHNGCDDVASCFASAATDNADLRTCEDRSKPGSAVGMARADWEQRKGATVTKFSQASTTKAEPIEVCGIPTENKWLADTTCDDGSKPFKTPYEAEAARVGNVGSGGRCSSIIDLYRVKCPEATYDVYVDGYVCPQ